MYKNCYYKENFLDQKFSIVTLSIRFQDSWWSFLFVKIRTDVVEKLQGIQLLHKLDQCFLEVATEQMSFVFGNYCPIL